MKKTGLNRDQWNSPCQPLTLEDKMSVHTKRLGILSYVNHDCLVRIITGCRPAKILYHLQVIPFVKDGPLESKSVLYYDTDLLVSACLLVMKARPGRNGILLLQARFPS